MNILNEVKRIREIMGIKSSKPLLMEQAALVRLFRKFMTKAGTKASTAFKRALVQSGSGYKGFKLTLQGFAENSKLSNEVLELLYEVLVRFPVGDNILKSPKLYNKYLKTLGVVMDDATAGVIGNRILLDGTDMGLDAFKNVIRKQTKTMSQFVTDLFPTIGKKGASGITGPKIKFLKTIFSEQNVLNQKELTTLLEKMGYTAKDAAENASKIIDGKILDGKTFDDLFNKVVNNKGLEDSVMEFFGGDKGWKEFVKTQGVVSEKSLKELLGTDDLITKLIYDELMSDSWFFRQKKRVGNLLTKKWFRVPVPWSKGFDMNLMKFIFGYIPFTLLYNTIWDWVLESEFKKSFMEKTQAMDGQLYATVKDHPGFFERVGGITVKEAQEIAATLKAALTSQWLPWEIVPTKYREYCKRDDNWKNECEECFGVSDDPENPYKKMEELNDEEMKLIGGKCIAKWFPAASNIEFDATRWQGTDDSTVIDVYENRIPTVIAASAVAYYYKRPPIGNTSHRLKDDLNKMTVSIVPPLITQSIAGLLSIGGLELQDIRTFDVLKIVDQLPFIIDSEGKSLKEQKKALEDAFLEFWPTMPLSLPDTECYCTKLVNGKWVDDLDTFKSVQNCNTCEEANIETWYTRKVGPIPTILTRMLIAKCDEKGTNTNDTTELQSCINNTNPMTMNIMCVKTKDPDLTGKPIYSPEYSPESAEVIALDGVEVMFGLDGATAGKEFLEKVKKKFDKNYVPPKEDE
tara:strand:- start:1468 stop:3702 length:2235 start_codon:yes stop_codon:yes gene_type:complete